MTEALSMPELGAAAFVVTVGALVQGTVGFGLALVAAPFLVLIEPRLVPGPLILAGLLLTFLIGHRERHAIDYSGMRWGLTGRLPGTAVGALTLAAIPASEMALALGALVLLAVAMSASALSLSPTRGTLLGAGVLSGFMGTIASIGGPPMALLYQHASGPRIRGTLSGYFVAGALMSLVALALVGRFGAEEIRAGLALLPGILLGFAFSRRTAPLLDGGQTRPAVLAVSAAAALSLILHELF
jgi:uncharacterized membrane protein YfcA